MDYSMVGPVLAFALASIGSCIGCGISGMTSHGVMSRVEEGSGKLIGMAAAPASQAIYGFVLMLLMAGAVKGDGENILPKDAALIIGVLAGLVMMLSAIFQGKCAASGILATGKRPSAYGSCFAAVAIIETFALFALAGAIITMQGAQEKMEQPAKASVAQVAEVSAE